LAFRLSKKMTFALTPWVALFVMGNKDASGTVVNADGVRSEFELAKKMGHYLVPIGSSGWMSQELWKEVMSDFDNNFPKQTAKIRPLMERLGEMVKLPTELLDPLLSLLDILATA
jgi:Sir2- and TIR-associating SLOG family